MTRLPEYTTVRLEPLGIEKRVPRGTPLIDILYQYGIEFPCGGKGTCGRCRITILKGKLRTSRQHDQYARKLDLPENVKLACMCFVDEPVELEIGQFETIILADNSEFDFTPREGFGIAIDLGTTTIVGQLLNLSDGKVINVVSMLNSQSRFGADIMSRVDFAVNRDGQEILHNTVKEDISNLVRKLSRGFTNDLRKIAIVGNSVMQHTFCNLDLRPLSAYPFESLKHKFFEFTPDQLGLAGMPGCAVTFYPSIGSFVGSDILAGIMSTGMHRQKKINVLIDLGTNGEICMGNREGILCASTAAGPAFEGTNITMGMTASTGAISSVFLKNNKLLCHTIGNEKARGICGSGIIDAVALFLDQGWINSTGQITADSDRIMLDGEVFLTQKDIYEFQLAKAAIASGVDILAAQLGIEKPEIDCLYIAGAFGNFINLENAIRLGLLEFPVDRITRFGNTALIGAKMALFQEYSEWEKILQVTRHLSLESCKEFQDVFVSKMFFDQPAITSYKKETNGNT